MNEACIDHSASGSSGGILPALIPAPFSVPHPGEPFRNFDAVVAAAKRIMRDLGIGARHITISTVGLVPEIRKFADLCAEDGMQLSLAISLHQSTDQAR